jgi:hypothetical protein
MKNNTVFYVVAIIAVLNCISFISSHSWQPLTFFVLATFAAYSVKPDKVFALVTGIVVSNLFSATMGVYEGYASKGRAEVKADSEKQVTDEQATDAMPVPTPNKKKSSTDQAASLNELMARQKELFQNIKNVQPMISQAQSMIKDMNLSPEFMQKAMEGFMKMKKK